MQVTRNCCSRNCSEEKMQADAMSWCCFGHKEAAVSRNSRITLTPAAPWSHQEELLNFSRKPFYPCADTLSHSVVCQTINQVLICRCFMDFKFFLQKHRNHQPLEDPVSKPCTGTSRLQLTISFHSMLGSRQAAGPRSMPAGEEISLYFSRASF